MRTSKRPNQQQNPLVPSCRRCLQLPFVKILMPRSSVKQVEEQRASRPESFAHMQRIRTLIRL